MATTLSEHLLTRLNPQFLVVGLTEYCCAQLRIAQFDAEQLFPGDEVSQLSYLRARYTDDVYVRVGAILVGYSPAESQLEQIIAEYDKLVEDSKQWQASRDEKYALEWAGL